MERTIGKYSYFSEVPLLIQRKELGINIPVYGTDPYHDPIVIENAKEATEGIYFTDVANPEGREWDNFVKNYTKRFNVQPNIVAAQSYETVKLVAEVMKKYGISSEEIKTGLSSIKGYIGATGPIEFNHNGDCITSTFYKYKIQNKQYIKVE